MAGVVIKKILTSLVVLFGALVLVFLIMNVLPGDPIFSIVDPTTTSPEEIAALKHELGMDKPLGQQFVEYVIDILHGDFGKSRASSEPVLALILKNLPKTIELTVVSVVISVTLGILLGILSAVFRNRVLDTVVRVLSLITISMPTFWTGVLFILLFSVKLRWLPSMGSEGFRTLILPSVTLGIVSSGVIVRMVRNSALEIINEPFIVTLRAKGLAERTVMLRHVLRNVMIPTITVIGLQVTNMLAGSVIIETVFSRQGIGRIISTAIMARDIPIVQGVVFFSAIICVVVNLVVDVSYAIIDPRVRRA
ncbi:MAG: ABC transporter permease [Oscillospiraceae bacterium]|jgi:peptide/nickel transport system permease protein|nr:ABC transporter permease [Oscillospiraceae bacterium]